MPVYEYEYTRKDGTTARVMRTNVPMSDSHKTIRVKDEDGSTYTAKRIMSVTAKMTHSWNYDKNTADLPPVDATPEDVAKAMRK